MNVNKIGLSTPNYSNSVGFKAKKSDDYENPVSRGTERNLAAWTSVCGSAVAGLVAGGLMSCISHPKETVEKGLKGFLKARKVPVIVGLATAATSLLVFLPSKLYNTKVNAFVKQKEMDVFSRDRDLKSNLTEEVGAEVKDPKVSLDKKLDDNLKLQMANRGSAIGIANVTSKPQG